MFRHLSVVVGSACVIFFCWLVSEKLPHKGLPYSAFDKAVPMSIVWIKLILSYIWLLFFRILVPIFVGHSHLSFSVSGPVVEVSSILYVGGAGCRSTRGPSCDGLVSKIYSLLSVF